MLQNQILFSIPGRFHRGLGKAGDGTSLGSPVIDASDINFLVNAGIVE